MSYRMHAKDVVIAPGAAFSGQSWNVLFDVMKERGITGLDAALKRLSKLSQVTRPNLDGCMELTDKGIAHLGRHAATARPCHQRLEGPNP